MAKRKPSPTPKAARAATRKRYENVALKAWKELRDTKAGGGLKPKQVLLHPHWRRLFIYYCTRHGVWRSDTLDNWEFKLFLALTRLQKAGVLGVDDDDEGDIG